MDHHHHQTKEMLNDNIGDGTLASNSKQIFQWPHSTTTKGKHSKKYKNMLQMKFNDRSWIWSTQFPIDKLGMSFLFFYFFFSLTSFFSSFFFSLLGNFVIVLRRTGGGIRCKYLMRVKVQQTKHDAIEIILLPESRRYPPYRIQNSTSMCIQICQANLSNSNKNIWDKIDPQHAM